MPRSGVTLQDVEQAVAELERRGQRVTQLAVRKALGDTGSMSTIRAHLETMRQTRSSEQSERQELPAEVADAVTRALSGVWDQAQAVARADVEAIRSAAQARSEALGRELEELSTAYDEQAEQLSQVEAALAQATAELRAAERALTVAIAEKAEGRKLNKALLARLDSQSEFIGQVTAQFGLGLETAPKPAQTRRKKKQD